MEVRSDRTFAFAVGPAELWAALTSVDRYRSWWPWLHRFGGAGVDGVSFAEGDRWVCAVRAPLGYPVRFSIALDEVVAGRSAAAGVAGDIAGRARLDVSPTAAGGSELRLLSTLTSERWLLRAIARLAPPVARRGHDRLLDTGVRQFREHAFPVGVGGDPGAHDGGGGGVTG